MEVTNRRGAEIAVAGELAATLFSRNPAEIEQAGTFPLLCQLVPVASGRMSSTMEQLLPAHQVTAGPVNSAMSMSLRVGR